MKIENGVRVGIFSRQNIYATISLYSQRMRIGVSLVSLLRLQLVKEEVGRLPQCFNFRAKSTSLIPNRRAAKIRTDHLILPRLWLLALFLFLLIPFLSRAAHPHNLPQHTQLLLQVLDLAFQLAALTTVVVNSDASPPALDTRLHSTRNILPKAVVPRTCRRALRPASPLRRAPLTCEFSP
ncbi:unnamed protein product [Chondrus crispus]|uniref:Uncharacterized protein n=1 Tax=Chondrus crispus TaxID=2769 RepID=R7Q6S3_CHOCR|nr:unnamed protein product [Chondrus crispus]CDF33170.1 unnamed protein product [Chondrus crispus]|eukprot:XP_005712973.1 unnamed protein product [Chondrus crispus]